MPAPGETFQFKTGAQAPTRSIRDVE